MGKLSRMRDQGKGPRGGVSKLLRRPLRKVISRSRGLEQLECGHEQMEVSGLMGPTNAERRRCRSCPDQEPKKQPTHRAERYEKGWILLVEGPPVLVRKAFESARYLGHRARVVGVGGRVLRECEKRKSS